MPPTFGTALPARAAAPFAPWLQENGPKYWKQNAFYKKLPKAEFAHLSPRVLPKFFKILESPERAERAQGGGVVAGKRTKDQAPQPAEIFCVHLLILLFRYFATFHFCPYHSPKLSLFSKLFNNSHA